MARKNLSSVAIVVFASCLLYDNYIYVINRLKQTGHNMKNFICLLLLSILCSMPYGEKISNFLEGLSIAKKHNKKILVYFL